MKIIKGLPIVPGYVIAKPLYYDSDSIQVDKHTISDITKEEALIDNAQKQVSTDLNQLLKNLSQRQGIDDEKKQILKDIINAHVMFANDTVVLDEIKAEIKQHKFNAAYAIKVVVDRYVEKFVALNDPYFTARISDIKDVFDRFTNFLYQRSNPDFMFLNEECVVIANDITPSISAQFDSKYVRGLLTKEGSVTSHNAIIATQLAIPLVSGVSDLAQMFAAKQVKLLIVDGCNGNVILDPDEATIKKYQALKEDYEAKVAELQKYQNVACKTVDGYELSLAINIGNSSDFSSEQAKFVDGIGLFRTEFLYMNNTDWPTLEEQIKEYEIVLKHAADNNTEVVIRTLDIGGDKELSYYKFPYEANPFLGVRALRFCFTKLDMFKTQLKALLLANKYHNLKIMFPMVASLDELLRAKKLLNETYDELKKDHPNLSNQYKIGVNIEIPGAVLVADHLAQNCDFFSIGSNDLIQYSLAADRLNTDLLYLYNSLNPSVLRAIKRTVDMAHKYNITCSVCGAMGGEALALPFLIGIKMDGVSVAANRILPVKKVVNTISSADCAALAKTVLELPSHKIITDTIIKFLSRHNLDYKIL